jgi:L-iditol 2-dehydrogenase
MEMQERAEPSLEADEVLIEVKAVGVCGSELSGYLGHNSLRVPPLVMGHEFAGKIVAVGSGVRDLSVADNVIVNPLVTCGQCVMCKQGRNNLCLQRQLVGAHRPGAFAEKVAVPAKNCSVLPVNLDFTGGSLAEPLACGVRTAELAAIKGNDRVLVIGAGAIGLMCIAAVKEASGNVVLISDIHAGRLETALSWGAENTLDSREGDVVAKTKSLTDGLGVDVVIDAVGSTQTRQTAIQSVRVGGTVIVIGLHEADSVLAINDMVRREITLMGSFAYTKANFTKAINMLAAGKIKVSEDWLEHRHLSDCAVTFAELVDKPPAVSKIVLRP